MAGGGGWEAVGRLALGAIQKNATESGKGATDSQRQALSKNSGNNMQMGEAPKADSANAMASAPSNMFPKALEIPGDTSLSWTQASRDADAALLAPIESARGGFAIQPTHVDSAQQTYQNSGLQNYLNYMKYRGGY